MSEVITFEDIGKCYNFAYESVKHSKSYWQQRNTYASTEKMIHDSFIGKLAEMNVYYHFLKKGYECVLPSFKTYKTKQDRIDNFKDDVDLKVIKENKIYNIHIKCVRFDSPVTNSWLIQDNCKTAIDPDDSDYFALCVFYTPFDIRVVKVIEANKVKWQLPRGNLPNKLACYLDDLEKQTE